jgi:hypothetical protein
VLREGVDDDGEPVLVALEMPAAGTALHLEGVQPVSGAEISDRTGALPPVPHDQGLAVGADEPEIGPERDTVVLTAASADHMHDTGWPGLAARTGHGSLLEEEGKRADGLGGQAAGWGVEPIRSACRLRLSM